MQINKINSVNCTNNKTSFGKITHINAPKVAVLKNSKKIVIVSGPSGVGKDTILNAFSEKFPEFLKKVVTCTTRQPRVGEVNGIHYNFLAVDEFRKGIDNNDFVEHVEIYPGKIYGTRVKDIKTALDNAKHNVILNIDVDGAAKATKMLEQKEFNVLRIFIKPKTTGMLEERLIKRGTETPETIKERVARADYEINKAYKDKYDVIIENNNDVPENVRDLEEVFGLV